MMFTSFVASAQVIGDPRTLEKEILFIKIQALVIGMIIAL